ncbi:hypothetical protein [Streptomyces sp. JNUCC 63]
MAAPAHLLLSALSKHVAEPPAPHLLPADDPLPAGDLLYADRLSADDSGLCAFSAESTCVEAPLTSEPPLPDAEPLTSEPPLAEAAPLTSESAAETADRDSGPAES